MFMVLVGVVVKLVISGCVIFGRVCSGKVV